MLNVGSFFLAELTEKLQDSVEVDHFIKWVSIEQAETLLFHEHQSWAVREAAELFQAN